MICRSRALQEVDVPRAARSAEARERGEGHAEAGEEATRAQASTDRCRGAVSARSSAIGVRWWSINKILSLFHEQMAYIIPIILNFSKLNC